MANIRFSTNASKEKDFLLSYGSGERLFHKLNDRRNHPVLVPVLSIVIRVKTLAREDFDHSAK
jgi:hypothetical protein